MSELIQDEPASQKARTFSVVPGVNTRGEAFLHLVMQHGPEAQTTALQCTPDEARSIAAQIMEAASSAEADSYLFQFLTTKIGTGPNEAVHVIYDFRVFRQQSGGGKNFGPDDPHWAEMGRQMQSNSKPKT
jgi:hypothetical protein